VAPPPPVPQLSPRSQFSRLVCAGREQTKKGAGRSTTVTTTSTTTNGSTSTTASSASASGGTRAGRKSERLANNLRLAQEDRMESALQASKQASACV
jgi:hypothetical protein